MASGRGPCAVEMTSTGATWIVNETVAATEAKFAANERHLASLQTTGH